ncbi:MAG: dockerin type I repeat-containing protein, partial [Ruminococcus sp.]|nr:dockerin type I repeat-containing protein [Ruminococcus sp.]
IPEDVRERCIYNITADEKDYSVMDVTFSSDVDGEESAKVCDFIYMDAIQPLYEYDSSIAYYVDCGDHNTTTVTGRDKLGMYNCITEQLYGVDEVTGKKWGLVDDSEDQYNGSGKSSGIYTANTWPDEANTADGADKSYSFRYTKNQYEAGIARHLDYSFELPNGNYSIELAFTDPWGCSKNPTAYANYGKSNEAVLATNAPTDRSAVKGNAKVTDGELTINLRSDDKAINICYIIIRPTDTESASVKGKKGDVNLDSTVDIADAVVMNKYILGKESITGEQAYAADIMSDANPDIFDMLMMRKMISNNA